MYIIISITPFHSKLYKLSEAVQLSGISCIQVEVLYLMSVQQATIFLSKISQQASLALYITSNSTIRWHPHGNSVSLTSPISYSIIKWRFTVSSMSDRKLSRYKNGDLSWVMHRSDLFRSISYQLKSMHCLAWSGGGGYSCWAYISYWKQKNNRGIDDYLSFSNPDSFPGVFVVFVEFHISTSEFLVTGG